jgi:hypothetical protein
VIISNVLWGKESAMTLAQQASLAPPQKPKHVSKPVTPPRPKPVAREPQAFSKGRSSIKPQIHAAAQTTVDPLAAAPGQPLASKEKAQSNGPSFEITKAPASSPKQRLLAAEQAEAIDRTLIPAMLASALDMDQFYDAKGYRAYLDKVLMAAGAPTDPIEIMWVEKLVMIHLGAAKLQAEAGQAKALEAIRIFYSASARWIDLFRMNALGLQVYRAAHRKPDRPAKTDVLGKRPNATADL